MTAMFRFLSRLWRRQPNVAGAPSTQTAVTSPGMVTAMMLDCESVMRELWDYLDGELTPDRTALMRAHIEVCKRCYPQYEFEREFLAALAARVPRHSQPERVESRVLAALEAEGLTDG